MDGGVEPYLAAVAFHKLGCRLGKEARKVHPRQEEIAGSGRSGQGVAQDREEDVGGGLSDRRVERRNADRGPEVAPDRPVLAVLLQKLQKGNVRLDAESRPLQRHQEAHGTEPLAERNAFRRKEAAEEVERRGKPERAEGKILRVADFERQAQEGV